MRSLAFALALLLMGGCGFGVPRTLPNQQFGPASPSPVSTALPRVGTGPAVPPPEPGLYTFSVIEQGPQGEERSEHQDVFEAASESPSGGFRQRVWHLQISGRPYHVDLLWRPEATYGLTQSFRLSGLCVFGPPMVVRKHPLKVGASWRTKTYCANDSPPRREISSQSKVVRTEELSIGGQTVSTFVIDYTLVLSGFREREGEELRYKGTEWYSPQHRMEVKQFIDYGLGSGGPNASYTEELKDLRPSSSDASSPAATPTPPPPRVRRGFSR